ncbi:uncharacterized protein LOC119726119 [Patiria miniata]|uniref:Uncharacterized protein n=1 Tax=Patiria miniata TaxID=46514 RepID=A0A913ZR79_PATMI|nr:uncharacterized protein LOC119726119 [Patiria miniata]
MEEANLACRTPSHTMALRQRRPRNVENDTLGSPVVARPSSGYEAGLIGERSALNAVSLNVGLTGLVPSLESKAGRQLRTVKRAWGTFKAKMKPSGRRGNGRGAKRHLLDITVTANPRTPEGVLRLMNSPLPLSAISTPSSLHRYRDPVVVTPSTPMSAVRRSERIARRTPTPMKMTSSRVIHRQMPRRLQSPGALTSEINRVTSQLDALTQGMSVFEAMETGITKSIARQESSMELQTESKKDESAKKELKGKRTSSLTSLKENFQKRLKKQTTGGETSAEETPGDKTKTDASNGTSTVKMQKGRRESSLTNLKNSLQRGVRTRKGQHPATDEEQMNGYLDDADEDEDAPLMM